MDGSVRLCFFFLFFPFLFFFLIAMWGFGDARICYKYVLREIDLCTSIIVRSSSGSSQPSQRTVLETRKQFKGGKQVSIREVTSA